MSGAAKMVELLPNLWVRPDQVQSLCAEDGGLISIQLVGVAPRQFYNHKDTPLAELAALLDQPAKWEQPPAPTRLDDQNEVVQRLQEHWRKASDYEPRIMSGAEPCSNCGMSYDECTQRILKKTGKACCRECYETDTHHAGEGAL